MTPESLKEHPVIDTPHKMQPVTWHILGAGAMGCLWAARMWQQANAAPERSWGSPPVTLLLHDDAAQQQWQEHGAITIHDGTGVERVPVAVADPRNTSSSIDNLLLCTKAQDAQPALRSVLHQLQPHSRVVLIQNGIKAQREIAQAFPSLSLYCLSTNHGAYRHGPFEVVHAGASDSYLGRFDLQQLVSRELDESLLSALPVEAMRIRWDRNITKRLWTKFAINCAINALTVVYDCRNGDLLTRPAAAADLATLCAEIERIMVTVPEAPQALDLSKEVEKVLHATAANFSSTLQDVRRGRPGEIAYFNAYLCELAQIAGVNRAMNTEVLRRFHACVNDRRH